MNTLIPQTLILLFVTAAALHAQDCWQERVTGSAPAPRYQHTAVWTGSEMIVWGGYGGVSNTGGRYNPAANSWTTVSTIGAPAAHLYHTAVWTGGEMIVWGGYYLDGGGVVYLNTGGRYNPATNSWTALNLTGAPSVRQAHTAVWTGSEMIVWGGTGGGNTYLNTGGRYNPATNSWTAMSTTGAPASRGWHTAVWTGSEMIVWGGSNNSSRFNTGGRYNPAANSWTAVSTTDAPALRYAHTAVWTGSEMIVWGGGGVGDTYLNDGGRYSPARNDWTAVSTTGAPAGRQQHTAVWTGSEMIVWGGRNTTEYLNDTFSYFPDCGAFRITSAVLDSGNLVLSFPTVTGRTYTLWQSDTMAEGTWTNTGLPAVAGTGATVIFTVPATTPGAASSAFFRRIP